MFWCYPWCLHSLFVFFSRFAVDDHQDTKDCAGAGGDAEIPFAASGAHQPDQTKDMGWTFGATRANLDKLPGLEC